MISAIKNIKRVFSQNGGGGGAAVNLVGSPCYFLMLKQQQE